MKIDVSPEEVENGELRSENHRAAVEAVRRDGFVSLEGVVNLEHLEMLKDRMLEDLETILAREDAPFNFNGINMQQDPPPFPPYLFKDVLLNDLVIQVTRSILGPGVKNAYYSGNTALPGGERQPVHPDVAQLWPGLEHPTPAFGLVINVPVVSMSPENGSTEIWPGSHLDTQFDISQGSIRIPRDVLDRRAAISPPVQPTVSAGSAVIRDIRLWHAGMPNHTRQPRPMIAMIHWCAWWNAGPVEFPRGTEGFFEHPRLQTVARFVEGKPDYLHHNTAYDYRKEKSESAS